MRGGFSLRETCPLLSFGFNRAITRRIVSCSTVRFLRRLVTVKGQLARPKGHDGANEKSPSNLNNYAILP